MFRVTSSTMSSIINPSIEDVRRQLDSTDDPRTRATLLNRLCQFMYMQDVGLAEGYAHQALRLSADHDIAEGITTAHIRLAECARLRGEIDSAREHLRLAERAVTRLQGDHGLKALLYQSFASLEHLRGNDAGAITCLHKALQECEAGDDPMSMSTTLTFLGDAYRMLGDFSKAMELLLRSRSLAERIEYPEGMAGALTNLACLYCDLGDFVQGLRAYQDSFAIYRALGNEYRRGIYCQAIILENIGSIYVRQGDFETAAGNYHESLHIREEHGWTNEAAGAHSNLASAYIAWGKWDKALHHAGSACRLHADCGALAGQAEALLNLGRISVALDDIGAAHEYLTEALEHVKDLGQPSLTVEIHEVLAQLHEAAGDPAVALTHFREVMRLRSELHSLEKNRAITAIQLRYELEGLEREREMLNMRADYLTQEITLKSNELVSMASVVARCRNSITRVQEQLLLLKRQYPCNAVRDVSAQLLPLLNAGLDDADWELFERKFREVHPSFIHSLTVQFSELTRTEIKVCSLLRLSLATKEIADILCTSVRTIDAHRRSIRKKVKLSPDASLSTFLMAM
ncbi:MAG: hypothetical protein JWQ98_1432 [Chlorobi bacterium]|nr:hypothetical protein [Chlorobiota bacterium]